MKVILSNIKWDITLLSRRIRHFGLHPVVGFLLLVVVSFVLPVILFERQKYFAPIYFCVGLFSLLPLNKKERCDFLRNCHAKMDYFLLRSLENILVILPYMIVFLIYRQYGYALVLLAIALFSLFFSFRKFSIVIPTPVLKSSFEFVLGFRYSFPLILGLYFICFEAAFHQNIALGMVALLLLFIVFIGYFFYAEPDVYVWIYRLSPKEFLYKKMLHTALNATILTLVPVLLLCFFFYQHLPIVLYFFLHGLCCLIFSIVLKYRMYPKPMNIGEEIVLVFTIICPLIPLVLWFALKKKTIHKLSTYL